MRIVSSPRAAPVAQSQVSKGRRAGVVTGSAPERGTLLRLTGATNAMVLAPLDPVLPVAVPCPWSVKFPTYARVPDNTRSPELP